jgi:hypothetical protein
MGSPVEGRMYPEMDAPKQPNSFAGSKLFSPIETSV